MLNRDFGQRLLTRKSTFGFSGTLKAPSSIFACWVKHSSCGPRSRSPPRLCRGSSFRIRANWPFCLLVNGATNPLWTSRDGSPAFGWACSVRDQPVGASDGVLCKRLHRSWRGAPSSDGDEVWAPG
jgi:hypothetical protein